MRAESRYEIVKLYLTIFECVQEFTVVTQTLVFANVWVKLTDMFQIWLLLLRYHNYFVTFCKNNQIHKQAKPLVNSFL